MLYFIGTLIKYIIFIVDLRFDDIGKKQSVTKIGRKNYRQNRLDKKSSTQPRNLSI